MYFNGVRMSTTENNKNSEIRTEYVFWYFGNAECVARDLLLKRAEVKAWGEFVPAEHVPAIERIFKRDAKAA